MDLKIKVMKEYLETIDIGEHPNIILVIHREGRSKNLKEKISSHKDMGMNMKLKLKKE